MNAQVWVGGEKAVAFERATLKGSDAANLLIKHNGNPYLMDYCGRETLPRAAEFGQEAVAKLLPERENVVQCGRP